MTAFKYDFHPSIIREYDVRGLVDKTLKATDAHAVGRSFGTAIARSGGAKVGICYDGRHSSPLFADNVAKGLSECGLNVEYYGLGPTAMGYFAVYERKLDGVVIITGSHNPPEYNGIKMMLKSGPVYGDMIRDIATRAASGDIHSAELGKIEKIDISEAYIDRMVADYKDFGKKPMKVAWDAGNGAAGALLKRMTDKLPGEHILLYADVDGDFPNHHPDPTVEKNLEDLKKVVREQGCDLGIAFDGDADRIGAVDSNGNPVWGDQLLALYAKEILVRKPGSTFVMDVKCSKTVSDAIASWGGKPLIWKTGHSLVKAKIVEEKAELGGELSGHIFFKDGYYGFDDGLYCAVRLLNVVNEFGPLAEQMKIFPHVYNTPEIRMDVPEEDKFAIMERAKIYVENVNHPGTSVLDIDGIRVSNADGWWLMRASNTQNALTMRAEGTSRDGLDRLVHSLKETLAAAGAEVAEPFY